MICLLWSGSFDNIYQGYSGREDCMSIRPKPLLLYCNYQYLLRCKSLCNPVVELALRVLMDSLLSS